MKIISNTTYKNRGIVKRLVMWTTVFFLLAGFSGCGSEEDNGKDSITISSIIVSPGTVTLSKGLSQQFAVTGKYSDGSEQEITNGVVWSSSAEGIAKFNSEANGLLYAYGVGDVNITAKVDDLTSDASVTVTDATVTDISVNASSSNLAKGTSAQLNATATYTDKTTADVTAQAEWTSTDTDKVSVDSKGLISAVNIGTSSITASLAGVESSISVSVSDAEILSMEITPGSFSVAKGLQQQITVMATYTDGSTQDISSQVVWVSESSNIATIETGGLATCIKEGETNITASLNEISASTVLTVTPAELASITLTSTSALLLIGETKDFNATGIYTDQTTQDLSSAVTWESSDISVFTADSNGLVTALGLGSEVLTASFSDINATSVIEVVTLVSLFDVSKSFSSYTSINGYYQSGSQFGIYLKSNAAGVYPLKSFEATDANDNIIGSTTLSSLLSENDIELNEKVGLTITLTSSAKGPLTAKFTLEDREGVEFQATGEFAD